MPTPAQRAANAERLLSDPVLKTTLEAMEAHVVKELRGRDSDGSEAFERWERVMVQKLRSIEWFKANLKHHLLTAKMLEHREQARKKRSSAVKKKTVKKTKVPRRK